MKQIISVILIICAFIMVLSGCNTHNDEENPPFSSLTGKFTDIKIVDETTAIQAAQDVAQQLNLDNAADELTLKNQTQVNGFTYYRLQQNYKGIPVYGRAIVVIADESGNAWGITSNAEDLSTNLQYFSTLTADIDQDELDLIINTLKKDELAICLKDIGLGDFIDISNIDIVSKTMYSIGNAAPVEAFILDVSFTSDNFPCSIEVIWDIADKKILSVVENVFAATSGSYELAYKLSSGNYALMDTKRHIYCFDANGKTIADYPEKYNKNEISLVESNSKTFDADCLELMDNVSKAYDYYQKKYSDNGCGECIAIMNHGDGTFGGYHSKNLITDIQLPESQNDMMATLYIEQKNISDLATICHEYTHTISRYHVEWISPGLNHENETGAINEGYSDIFGVLMRSAIEGTKVSWTCCGRNISDPAKCNYPSVAYSRKLYQDTYKNEPMLGVEGTNTDYAHGYSTVISHAAYLMSTDNKSYGKLSTDELSDLWYNTMLTLPSNCTFSVLRENMEMVAEITGLSDEKRDCISDAFDEVGIKSQGNEFATDFELTVTDSTGNVCTDYTIEITGTKSSVFWEKGTTYQDTVIVSGEQAHKITLSEGSYELKITEKATGKSMSRKIRTAKLSRKNKLQISLLRNSVKESTSTILKDVYKAYKEQLKNYNNVYGGYTAEYMLHDMDNNGIPELIVKGGTCEAAYMLEIYSYNNGIVSCGTTGAGHSSLAVPNDRKGLFVCWQHMGYESRYLLTLQDYKINRTVLFEGREPDETEKLNYLEIYQILDISPLRTEEENEAVASVLELSQLLSDRKWYGEHGDIPVIVFSFVASYEGNCDGYIGLYDENENALYSDGSKIIANADGFDTRYNSLYDELIVCTLNQKKTLTVTDADGSKKVFLWDANALNNQKGWYVTEDERLVIEGKEYHKK